MLFTLGVQRGSMHSESKQSQSRKAIIRMLGKLFVWRLINFNFPQRFYG